jgi:hypothetical protein
MLVTSLMMWVSLCRYSSPDNFFVMVDQKARCVDLDGRRIMKRVNITIKVKKEVGRLVRRRTHALRKWLRVPSLHTHEATTRCVQTRRQSMALVPT